MNQVALLLDPLQFPHHLFAKALNWAKVHDSSFKSIIITDEKMNVERVSPGQPVTPPSELVPLTIEGHINQMMHHVKHMRQQVVTAGLHFSNLILVQPRIKDVLEEIRLAQIIFLEFRHDRPTSSFSWDELLHLIPMHKQIISNTAHG